nr:nucleoside deaminase [Prochlorococcus marinus]
MRRLLNRANELGKEDEVPVIAMILDNKGHCIGHGRNTRNTERDPLGHAELVALRQAKWLKKDWRFNDCTIIVTLEPCQMCAGALIQARMGKVIFGAPDTKRGGLGGSIDLSIHKSAHHKMIVHGGVMKYEAQELIRKWFSQRRRKRYG